MADPSKFDGGKVANLRLEKRLTQAQLARLAGLTQPQLSDLENDVSPSADTIARLADALDCSIDFLFGRKRRYRSVTEAAIQMSLEIAADRELISTEQFERCRRVLGHQAAPRTADGWRSLAEQIDLAVGSSDNPTRLKIARRQR